MPEPKALIASQNSSTCELAAINALKTIDSDSYVLVSERLFLMTHS